MDPLQEHHRHAAIAICQSFLNRLASLDEAMFNSLDDIDTGVTEATVLPQHFNTNAAHRTTFAVLATHNYDPASWHHHTILSEYIQLLCISASCDRFSLLDPLCPGYQEAVGRWVGWEAIDARWPFKLSVETSIGEQLFCVCTAIWDSLSVVAAAALQEEARVGPCRFDVMAKLGVVGRMADTADRAGGGVWWVGSQLVWWVRDRVTVGRKMKQD